MEDFFEPMKVNQTEIVEFLQREFPQSLEKCRIDHVAEKSSVVTYLVGDSELRPGGTVSGPTMMTVADLALYVAILAEIGVVALAVTNQMNINFLRKPAGHQNLRGECRLLKVGQSLVYGEVWVYSETVDEPVAHITGSYSIPRGDMN